MAAKRKGKASKNFREKRLKAHPEGPIKYAKAKRAKKFNNAQAKNRRRGRKGHKDI